MPLERRRGRCASSLLVGLHHRQPQAADVVAEQVQRGLDRVGLVVQNIAAKTSRSEASISARWSGSSNIRRISVPTMWLETQMPPAQPEVERAREVLVVAGQDRQPVDRPEVGRVGLLDRLDPVDLAQLGQQLAVDVDGRAARDVVDDHRRPGRPRARPPRNGG